MASKLSLRVVFALALLHRTQSRPEDSSPKTTNSISTVTDEFPDTESPEITEESQDLSEELEEPNNSCYLMSFEAGIKAVYICEDGNVWAATIDQLEDNCVYKRNVTDPSGEIDIKEATINCIQGKEWIQDLVQNNIIYGIPDKLLFEAEALESDENTTDQD